MNVPERDGLKRSRRKFTQKSLADVPCNDAPWHLEFEQIIAVDRLTQNYVRHPCNAGLW